MLQSPAALRTTFDDAAQAFVDEVKGCARQGCKQTIDELPLTVVPVASLLSNRTLADDACKALQLLAHRTEPLAQAVYEEAIDTGLLYRYVTDAPGFFGREQAAGLLQTCYAYSRIRQYEEEERTAHSVLLHLSRELRVERQDCCDVDSHVEIIAVFTFLAGHSLQLAHQVLGLGVLAPIVYAALDNGEKLGPDLGELQRTARECVCALASHDEDIWLHVLKERDAVAGRLGISEQRAAARLNIPDRPVDA